MKIKAVHEGGPGGGQVEVAGATGLEPAASCSDKQSAKNRNVGI
jgi:hypothetical protein